MSSLIDLTAPDGHVFEAYHATPPGRPRGAVVIVQEIFGVNDHIRSVTDGWAAEGYLAIAPAFFDRVQRGYVCSGYGPDEINASIALMQQVDMDDALLDLGAAVTQVAGAGRVGILGFCWGGTVSWVAAARTRGLACAVPYYGGGMPQYIGEQPAVPVLAHFGEQDTRPSAEQARAIVAAHPGITAHFYAAGHAFNREHSASYDAAAATLARVRTLAFLRDNVG
jgi:carboxymethylenebutenolidase